MPLHVVHLPADIALSVFLMYTGLMTAALLVHIVYQDSGRKEPLSMVDLLAMQQRLHHWCQTPETRLPDDSMAPAFIERVGVATLYPASPEFPNLFSAYVGDPD